MSGGQGGYYSGLAREDYYLNGGEPPGVWLGDGAEKLGLSGQIQREEFLELFDGFQGGEALVQNAGKANHRPGWDLTFSAPKSVSVAWSQADRETSLEIRAAHLTAVEAALKYLQQDAIWTRRGKEGHVQERCDIVVAAFEHGTSRAQDPQLHTHALLLNLGVRADGSVGTLETKDLYRHIHAAGALYRAELARQLERRLGLFAEREAFSFRLSGVSESLVEEFSKRRTEIEAALTEKGLRGAKASAIAAFETREVKTVESREKLRQQWGAVGKEHAWSTAELSALMRGPQPERKPERSLQETCREAYQKLTEKNAYFKERDVVKFVAQEAQTLAVGAAGVIAAVKSDLESSKEIVRLGLRRGEIVFTTHEMLQVEKKLMADVLTSKGTGWKRVDEETMAKVLAERGTISEEQAKAVRHITQGSGSIACVAGMAGTGKTFMLDAARDAWERQGLRVLGAALAGKAAEGMQDGAKIQSSTIASLLKRLEGGKQRLDSDSVLVVDEAGMVGTRQMQKLVAACGQAGAKLVLVGDEKQLQAIEAGGAFASMSAELGTAKLTEIIRQRAAWQVEGVKNFAFGNAAQALSAYAERGFVSVAANKRAAYDELLTAWGNKQGHANPKDNLIAAGTRLDVATLNRKAQEARLHEGFIKEAGIQIGKDEFHEGDRILFTKNSTALGVKNGTFATVFSIDERLKQISVTLDNGQQRTFSTLSYDDVQLGYAVTTHKAQGMTAENVFILTSETMQDRELSYVQASRGKGETRFFTTHAEAGDKLAELARTMNVSHQKEMAVEVAGPTQDHEHDQEIEY